MTAEATSGGRGLRRDIQGLRAVAILLVVLWHAGVAFLPGGFVGVDVFFVVSGFLITGLLVRELRTTGRIRLPAFWARRARRLLPAALLVLLVTAIASVFLLPREFWSGTSGEVAASVLYVENWALAISSTDYLAQDADPTVVQHFWSLSVEEQFYVVWPLLLLAAAGLAILVKRGRRLIPAVVLGGVTVASFVWSLSWATHSPATAYVATPTRGWEFGVGALLALMPPGWIEERMRGAAGRAARAALGWAGVATIVASAVLFDSGVPYPGTAALAPVLGTTAVIAATGDAVRGAPSSLLGLAPVQQLGRISYSLYLWHWPVLVLAGYAVGKDPLPRVVAVILSVALAVATTVLVEEPIRDGRLRRMRPRATLLPAAAGMAVVLVVAGAGWGSIQLQRSSDLREVASLEGTPCFGAAAIAEPSRCDLSGTRDLVVPSPAASDQDLSEAWYDCDPVGTEARECVLGKKGGMRVALIGDSHAHHWDAALEKIADERGWELHLLFKNGCAFSHVEWPGASGSSDPVRCAKWNRAVDRQLAEDDPYQLVITAMRADDKHLTGADAAEVATAGFRESWQPLIDRGATIVALRDVPAANAGLRQCVDRNRDDTAHCSLAESDALPTDWLAVAASRIPGARVVDVTDLFCRAGTCPAVIGDVLVYRDAQHLTATYAASTAPYLAPRLLDAVGAG